MARGNGKQANDAMRSGRLAAFVTKTESSGQNGGRGLFVDWGEIQPSLLVGAVTATVAQGGALLFGCSRDNTSYSVKIYFSGDSKAYYFPTTESGIVDLETFLMALVEAGTELS